MKIKRHLKILELVRSQNIETQEALTELLNKEGFSVTQATISRDIKELRLVKIASDDGHYKYSVSETAGNEDSMAKYLNILGDAVRKIDVAQNIVVIKTYSGMAQAAAAALDSMNYVEIVGSIAGDDTIFLVFHKNQAAIEFSEKLMRITVR